MARLLCGGLDKRFSDQGDLEVWQWPWYPISLSVMQSAPSLTQRGLVDPYNFHSLMQLTALEREGLKVILDGQGSWEGLG